MISLSHNRCMRNFMLQNLIILLFIVSLTYLNMFSKLLQSLSVRCIYSTSSTVFCKFWLEFFLFFNDFPNNKNLLVRPDIPNYFCIMWWANIFFVSSFLWLTAVSVLRAFLILPVLTGPSISTWGLIEKLQFEGEELSLAI